MSTTHTKRRTRTRLGLVAAVVLAVTASGSTAFADISSGGDDGSTDRRVDIKRITPVIVGK